MRFLVLLTALDLTGAGGVQADGLVGPYLAGRVASYHADYAAAAKYFTLALQGDPKNQTLMENAILSDIAIGEFEDALTISKGLSDVGANSSLADLAVLSNLAKQGQYDAAIAELDKGRTAGKLADGLYRAWAQVGRGQVSEATTAFDDVAKVKGLTSFALYQKALALALVGDFEGADNILSGDAAGPLRATRRSLIAHAQVLSQLERNDAAVELFDKTFGPDTNDPTIVAMRADLVAGKTLPFDMVKNAQDGMAEMFYSVASAISTIPAKESNTTPTDVLLYARAAIYLRPDHTDAILLAASSLENQREYDLAIETFSLIKPDSPAHISAELGRADALIAADRSDAAIEALQQLANANPNLIEVWAALGDTQRREKHFGEAISAYDNAIALIKEPVPAHWVVYYARGISNEREGHWDKAEPDFRKALELNPDQPQVLNYLGYSYLEKQINLDEALTMIDRAAKAEPDDGAIADSLGWALYRLGRYTEAEIQMEKAIGLAPGDSVVNDHLGDVYWAVGRKREADFQWRRALSFNPDTEEEAARIRRKLEVGLDAVLKEEGAAPLAVTDNGD